jgi:hypothetical protein
LSPKVKGKSSSGRDAVTYCIATRSGLTETKKDQDPSNRVGFLSRTLPPIGRVVYRSRIVPPGSLGDDGVEEDAREPAGPGGSPPGVKPLTCNELVLEFIDLHTITPLTILTVQSNLDEARRAGPVADHFLKLADLLAFFLGLPQGDGVDPELEALG